MIIGVSHYLGDIGTGSKETGRFSRGEPVHHEGHLLAVDSGVCKTTFRVLRAQTKFGILNIRQRVPKLTYQVNRQFGIACRSRHYVSRVPLQQYSFGQHKT